MRTPVSVPRVFVLLGCGVALVAILTGCGRARTSS
jgi:hypothetical protein